MLIDTHSHLNLSPLFDTWKSILDRSQRAGVSPIIVPGVDLDSSRTAVEMAGMDPRLYASVGIHPDSISPSIEKFKSDIEEIGKLTSNSRVVAIGECGLDYHRSTEFKDIQKQYFRAQVQLAENTQLPLIIHTREKGALTDSLKVLSEFTLTGLVFHCFSGDLEFWQKIEPMGAMIGVGATITYPKNQELRETIKHIPLDRIVMETDAPWLPPQSMRGKINEPQNVTIAACKLAEIKEVQLSEVLKTTMKNSLTLFPRISL